MDFNQRDVHCSFQTSVNLMCINIYTPHLFYIHSEIILHIGNANMAMKISTVDDSPIRPLFSGLKTPAGLMHLLQLDVELSILEKLHWIGFVGKI